MEIIIIPKEILNSEYDQKLYLFKTKVSNKHLIYLFKYKGYYVFHVRFNFIIEPFLYKVIQYVKDSFKENDQNVLNLKF